jgi:hypothetical protein
MSVNDYAADFGLFRLSNILSELGCAGATQTALITWYWKNARSWDASDQIEVDSIARENLRRITPAPDGSEEAQRQVIQRMWERERARQRGVERHNAAVTTDDVKPWKPCEHWTQGSGRRCSICVNPTPGALARAQKLYDDHRKFVLHRSRLVRG